MANDEHVAQLKQGVDAWNAWRNENPGIDPDLQGANLTGADLHMAFLTGANLTEANLTGADLIGAKLTGAKLTGAKLHKANFYRADLREADLTVAHLTMANLNGADLRKAFLHRAHLHEAFLRRADLREANLNEADLTVANLREADLSGAKLRGADLRGASLVKADLTDADLTSCRIYGISAWGLKLEGTKQKNLVITTDDEPEVTVDDIEVAQFIYLLLHNPKIRDAIDTIGKKAVLILGRFSLQQRKEVLDKLRDELRNRGYLPILFDFSIPESRDVTETIKVLAGLARFVIADITDATEVRAELHNIVRDFTSLAIQPILLRGHSEFVSLSHLKNFPWLLPTFEYDSLEDPLANLDKSVIGCAEEKVLELRGKTMPQAPKN